MGRIPPFFLILIAILGVLYSGVSQAMNPEDEPSNVVASQLSTKEILLDISTSNGIVGTSSRRTQPRCVYCQHPGLELICKLNQAAIEQRDNKIKELSAENAFLTTQAKKWYQENLTNVQKSNTALRRLSSEQLKRQTMLEDDIHARSCWQLVKVSLVKFCRFFY